MRIAFADGALVNFGRDMARLARLAAYEVVDRSCCQPALLQVADSAQQIDMIVAIARTEGWRQKRRMRYRKRAGARARAVCGERADHDESGSQRVRGSGHQKDLVLGPRLAEFEVDFDVQVAARFRIRNHSN